MSLDASDGRGKTPLFHIADAQSLDGINYLIRNGPSAKAMCCDDGTSLGRLAQLLSDSQANVNQISRAVRAARSAHDVPARLTLDAPTIPNTTLMF
jgi:hypothetical protein